MLLVFFFNKRGVGIHNLLELRQVWELQLLQVGRSAIPTQRKQVLGEADPGVAEEAPQPEWLEQVRADGSFPHIPASCSCFPP